MGSKGLLTVATLKRREIDPEWPVMQLLQTFRLVKVKPLPTAKAAA
jgi:hypothetical protein